jgi:hypothetical protein
VKKLIILAGAIAAIATTVPASAQVVVTGTRQDRSAGNAYFKGNNRVAAIGVTRRADYFVTPLYVSSDSRNYEERKTELFQMLDATLDAASAEGITLVAGRYTLEPVTKANMRDLRLESGSRPDTNRVQIYARVPLKGQNPNARDTAKRIKALVKDIPATGRSFIDVGNTSLAIDKPEQYRGDVVRHIAKEATGYAAMFGDGYGVEIEGLEGELYWQQSSETEVFLYIEHSFSIEPR